MTDIEPVETIKLTPLSNREEEISYGGKATWPLKEGDRVSQRCKSPPNHLMGDVQSPKARKLSYFTRGI